MLKFVEFEANLKQTNKRNATAPKLVINSRVLGTVIVITTTIATHARISFSHII